VEAATKPLLDTKGGKSLEIVLSPAVKKPKSRVSPPTSPSAPTQESIEQKLKEAEERKKIIETDRIKSLANQLAKIDLAQQKREESEKAKADKIKANEAKLHAADEKKSKVLADVKDKMSEHMGKIEKAQKELEASVEAARMAAEASLNEKMEKMEVMKNLQMEDMLKKIKEHQEHVKEVKSNQEEMLKPHVEKVHATIKAKEERAREIREKKDLDLKEKFAEQNKRAEIARLNREKLQKETALESMTSESA